MELIPVASAVVGLLGGIVRLLNATGVTRSPKQQKGIDNPDAKLTLTPPLFERHNDRNASVHSPLDAFDLHRQALFSHFMADGHALIATAQLQPTQQNYHDVMARVRLPSEAVSVWPFAARPSSAPPSYYAATQSSTPVLDAIVRIQPAPAEPTFLQVKLSSDRGGVADAIGCYKLPIDALFARTTTVLRPATASSSISMQPPPLSYAASTAITRPAPATPTSASPSSTVTAAAVDTSLNPQLALFFAAPLFENSPALAAPAAPSVDEHKPALGLRVDHLGTSLGVRVDPLDPSSSVSGWLSSSTFLSANENAALRGGFSFTTGVNPLPASSAGSSPSSLSFMAQTARIDGKLFYTQMVDADTDERYQSTVVRSPVPAYEIGVTLRNGGEELITSFYNHTTVRRKVYNPLEKKNIVGMHNYCLAEGTLVAMADGTSVPIEHVKVSALVLSYSSSAIAGPGVGAGQTEGLVVRQVHDRMDNGVQQCVELLFSDGRILVCTPNHRIRTADARWVRADTLVVGLDEVAVGVEYPQSTPTPTRTADTADDDVALPLFKVQLIGRRAVGERRVFDLSVPNPDNDDDGDRSFVAGGIVVHNCDIGMELAMRRAQQPAWRLAAAWQLNKNTLLKCRVSDTEIAAAVALKSWHTPNTTASAAVHYDYKGSGVRVGVSMAVDNVGSVLFGRAPVGYKRVVSAKRSDVTYQYNSEEDY